MKKGQHNPMAKVHYKKMAGKQEYGILSYGHHPILFLYAKVGSPYPDKDTFSYLSFARIRYGCSVGTLHGSHSVSGQ
ncbi:hypothetical protein [Phocaeicola sp.]